MLKKNNFITATLYLLVGGAITRSIGFVIRIVYTRMIGNEGIALFSLVMPTYSMLITIATLALLRDDICCLDACLATSFYHGPVKQGERLAELDSLVAGYQQAVDQVVEPYHHELRRLWIEFDEAAPAELLAMLSYGANPWWLDIVDPIWKGLKRHEDTAPMLLAAGASMVPRTSHGNSSVGL